MPKTKAIAWCGGIVKLHKCKFEFIENFDGVYLFTCFRCGDNCRIHKNNFHRKDSK